MCSSDLAWKSSIYPKNKYKTEQTEKSTTLLRSLREVRAQGQLLPPQTGETDRQTQRITLTRAETEELQRPGEPEL